MLKIISKTKETNASEFLFKKDRMIVITNHCNLNCGGCSQLIGQFTKNQLWNITLEDLEKSIQLLKKNPSKHPITIFGGEPTLHPQWNEIVKLLKSHTPTNFKITTNGRLGHKSKKEGYGLISLWHDKYTDIVGGIFKIN